MAGHVLQLPGTSLAFAASSRPFRFSSLSTARSMPAKFARAALVRRVVHLRPRAHTILPAHFRSGSRSKCSQSGHESLEGMTVNAAAGRSRGTRSRIRFVLDRKSCRRFLLDVLLPLLIIVFAHYAYTTLIAWVMSPGSYHNCC
jgi:hypothetical protein